MEASFSFATHTAVTDNCLSKATSINECESNALMRNTTQSSEASDTTSSSSSQKGKGKGKRVPCKRLNPKVLIRRHRANNVDTIGLPLGMSFAAVMAQVLYRRDAAPESMSPNHLSTMCSSAIKESLVSVFGDKLDGLMRNFEQSFSSTLSTLQLIYESSNSIDENKLNNTKMEFVSSNLTPNQGECSGDIVKEDGHAKPSHAEIQDKSISRDSPEEVRDNHHMDSIGRDSLEEGGHKFHKDSISRDSPEEVMDNLHHMDSIGRDSLEEGGHKFRKDSISRDPPEEDGDNFHMNSVNCDSPKEGGDNFHTDSICHDSPEDGGDNFHMNSVSLDSPQEGKDNFDMDSVSRDLSLYAQSNQMVSFSQISFGSVNNPMVSIVEKSIVEQCRSNDLKTLELGLKMKELKLKEDELALNLDSNNLNRSKLAIGESKQSFKEEKFKTQLEDTRHCELKKKCIDCLITGLFIMSSSLLYGAYVYSHERITEATASCIPSTQESSSWWTPKSVILINSRLHILWCQVQVMSRMLFGVLMIFAVAYLLMQRSTTSSQTMPVTFVLLMLGIGCGYCGKLCVETLGGNGNVWLLYWEILCLLYFLSLCWTSALFRILHGPVTASQTIKENPIFRYWIRRFLFYATLLVFLPLFCGLMPFASLDQWKDHFTLKESDFNVFE
ncbi:hypothetical protein VNO78_01980 [Psophocarpus tetragonolobus]|uniref:Protein CPR-5 n=1 Tax=Psophocarpus tetragonolobus TaxID=3891 RepID=A0AAN9XVF5_PSOTE